MWVYIYILFEYFGTCIGVCEQTNTPVRVSSAAQSSAVGFHNFNLRTFNLRVSNPSKFIVDVFFDTMSDFNVPGSRPKKKR